MNSKIWKTAALLAVIAVSAAFNLDNAIVPPGDILSGGPPKDGIPAILDPKFATTAEVDFLRDSDVVIGVEIGGVQRAYPAEDMIERGVINDEINGVPLALVAHGSAITVFSRQLGDQVLDFSRGEGDVFHDSTGSTWNMKGKAVSGPLSGSHLEVVPHASRVLWFIWSNFYPDTEVAGVRG